MNHDALVAFILSRTAPAAVPLVPEIVLQQATEVTPLWRATAEELAPWDPAPFWAFPWAGGQALARYLLDRPGVARGLRVVDFASGSGLVAIAAARAGAASVVAWDTDPVCAAAIKLNAERNGARIEIHIGDTLDAEVDADLILAGDVFYERELAERSLRWFARCAARGSRVLVGDPGRVYSPDDLRVLAAFDVPTTPDLEGATVLRTRVLEVAAARKVTSTA